MNAERGMNAEPARAVSPAEALRRVRTEGWCVIDNVIPPDDLPAVRAGVAAALDGRDELNGVIARDRSFAPYLVDERLAAIAEGVFGPAWRIARTDACRSGRGVTGPAPDAPGRSAAGPHPHPAGTGWHADWPFASAQGAGDGRRAAVPYGDLAMAVTTLWTLTGAPDEPGATLIVSGSHRTHDNPAVAPGYAADARIASQMLPAVPAGSVLAFDSRLWHRHLSAEPGAGEHRLWLDVQYVPWWLDLTSMIPGLADYEARAEGLGYRPAELQPLDDAAFRALPDAVQPLFDHLRLGQEVIAWHPDPPASC